MQDPEKMAMSSHGGYRDALHGIVCPKAAPEDRKKGPVPELGDTQTVAECLGFVLEVIILEFMRFGVYPE